MRHDNRIHREPEATPQHAARPITTTRTRSVTAVPPLFISAAGLRRSEGERRRRTRSGGSWLASIIMMIVLGTALGGTRALAQIPGDPCDSLSFAAVWTGQGCCWRFTITNNQTTYNFTNVTATILTPGNTVASAAGGFPATTTSTTINWAYPNTLPKGSTFTSGCFNAGTGVITLLIEYSIPGAVPCRDTITIDCPTQNHRDTLRGTKFWDQDCDGKRDPGEPGLAGWVIKLSNGDSAITDASGNYIFTNIAPGTYTLNEVNQSGWTQSYPSTPGTHTVTIATGQAINNLDFGNCRNEPTHGCLETRGDTTWCEGFNGQWNIYVHQFSIRSLLPCQFSQSASFTVLNPGGISISPASMPVSNTPSNQSIILSGPGAVTGAVVLIQVKICCVATDPAGVVDTLECCLDTIRIVLPPCGPPQEDCPDCCKEFKKRFEKVYQWSASNGHTSVGGYLQAGNTTICTVSATLVDVKINGAPAYGQFIPLNMLGGNPGTIPYMHEVVWTGVDVSTGLTPFSLKLKFPPMAPHTFSDKITYCIRFRFTDRNCRTCDTVICFTQKRTKWIIFDDIGFGRLGTEEKSGAPGVLAAPGPVFTGTLTGEESGRLDVTFPEPPAEFGAIRYVGLAIDPAEEFVEITGATGDDYAFTARANGVESAPFSAAPGESTGLDLEYNGLNGRSMMDHYVTLRFVMADAPDDTLEESGIVRFHRGALEGGDELTQQPYDAATKTYALYLHNANGSDEPIDRLAISVPEGVEIVAVGPAPAERQAILSLAEGTRDAASIDLAGGAPLGSDTTIGPIYVTLAGAGESVDLGFTTLNGAGITISEGTVTLVNNPSSVDDGDRGQAGGSLLQGIYPNPSDAGTTISFALSSHSASVTLVVTDAAGREVARLLDGAALRPGGHMVTLDGTDLPSGAYFVTLRADGETSTAPLQIRR